MEEETIEEGEETEEGVFFFRYLWKLGNGIKREHVHAKDDKLEIN